MTTINLQAIGSVSAKPASDFNVGDRMMWNFGSINEVTGIAKETAAFITFVLDGQYERRMKKDRLVAIG